MSETTKKTPAKKLLEKFGKYSKNEMAIEFSTINSTLTGIFDELHLEKTTPAVYGLKQCRLFDAICDILNNRTFRDAELELERLLDKAVAIKAFGEDERAGFKKSCELFAAIGKEIGGRKSCSGRPRRRT